MGAGMLRTEIERVYLFDAGGDVYCSAINLFSLVICAGFAEIFPQRAVVRILRKQKRPQIRISGKFYPEKVVDFALEPAGPAKNIANGGRGLFMAAQKPSPPPAIRGS